MKRSVSYTVLILRREIMKFKVGDIVKYIGDKTPTIRIDSEEPLKNTNYVVANCDRIESHGIIATIAKKVKDPTNVVEVKFFSGDSIVLLSEWRKEQKARINASKTVLNMILQGQKRISKIFKSYNGRINASKLAEMTHKSHKDRIKSFIEKYYPAGPQQPSITRKFEGINYYYTDVDGSSRKGSYVEPSNYGDVTITGNVGGSEWDEAVKGLIDTLTNKPDQTQQATAEPTVAKDATAQKDEEIDILDITRRMLG
jgi:hypothetical protein